jgi:pimeloyl-ACP methyl ester carboxylesterase
MLEFALPLAGAAAVLSYGSAYAAWANARWPAQGRFLEVDGTRLHVVEAGDGAPVLCLHGASANAREFAASIAPHAGAGLRLLMLDRPGHGHSARPAGAHRLEVQARLAAGALEAMKTGPALILAHSLGCATALRLALDRPDLVRGLVLVSPASHPYPGANAWHAHLAATPVIGPLFVRLAVPLAGPTMSGSAVANTFRPSTPPAGYARASGLGLLFRPRTFLANARDVVATKAEFEAQYFRYPEIEAPTVILTAEKDAVVSPKIHASALARTLPNAELVTIPGAGHMPHHARPEAVIAALRRLAEME